jgi:MFS family permease
MVTPEEVLAAQATASGTRLAFYCFVTILHGMGVGSGLGYAGLMMPHHINASSPLLHLTVDQGSWFVSISPLAMLFGVLLSIPASERLGRTKVFLTSQTLNLLGYLGLYLAPSFPLLMAARSVQCFGAGFTAMTTGVYLTEISTVRMRGPVSGCNMTSNVIGILCYTALCIVLPIQLLPLVQAANCALVFVLVLVLPESPQWLVDSGFGSKLGPPNGHWLDIQPLVGYQTRLDIKTGWISNHRCEIQPLVGYQTTYWCEIPPLVGYPTTLWYNRPDWLCSAVQCSAVKYSSP